MKNKDIRWEQRLDNLISAFTQLSEFIKNDKLSILETQGLIKAFEYNYELSWKTLQDLLKYRGYNDLHGPRPVIEQAFQDKLIEDGEGWMNMHQSRNMTSHTYNSETAFDVAQEIRVLYFGLFKELIETLNNLREK